MLVQSTARNRGTPQSSRPLGNGNRLGAFLFLTLGQCFQVFFFFLELIGVMYHKPRASLSLLTDLPPLPHPHLRHYHKSFSGRGSIPEQYRTNILSYPRAAGVSIILLTTDGTPRKNHNTWTNNKHPRSSSMYPLGGRWMESRNHARWPCCHLPADGALVQHLPAGIFRGTQLHCHQIEDSPDTIA